MFGRITVKSLIESWLKHSLIEPCDRFLYEEIAAEDEVPEVAACLLYLAAGLRQGHLCMLRNGRTLFPILESSPSNDSASKFPQGDSLDVLEEDLLDAKQVADFVLSGWDLLLNNRQHYSSWITVWNEQLEENKSVAEQLPKTPLVACGDRLYFQRFFWLERQIHLQLSKLIEMQPTLKVDHELIVDACSIMEHSKKLSSYQRQAVEQFCKNSVTFLAGGPGTGKTYTAAHAIRLFWDALSSDQKTSCSIAVAAPTGKAATHLANAMNNLLKDMNDPPKIQGKTVHGLLGMQAGGWVAKKPKMPLMHQVILVDEASMMDLNMMHHLLESVCRGSRLLLLGDPGQLPPISLGSLFADFLDRYPKESVRLMASHRTTSLAILGAAQAVTVGDASLFREYLDEGHAELQYYPIEVSESNIFALQKELIRQFCLRLSNAYDVNSPWELLQNFQQFRLLSPLREGLLGCDQLNREIYKTFFNDYRREQEAYWIPILVTQNDAMNQLHNGDVGVLVQKRSRSQKVSSTDYALFAGFSAEQPVRRIPALALPHFEYAYCLSVHKSQGSEFDELFLVVPQGAEQFGRELLYTGLTRAKKKIDLWGSWSTLEKMVQRSSRRVSSI